MSSYFFNVRRPNGRVYLPGGNPYPGVEINEKFIGLLKSGYRMDKPKFASDEV